ncbi:unnamed protein product, partial [Heterosigma akashiwo]
MEKKTPLRSSGRGLYSPNVFLRIRPPTFDGGGHDMRGDSVAKSLVAWSEKSVTLSTEYMFSRGSKEYSFATRVIQPEESQDEACGALLDGVVESFTSLSAGKNILFLAYGQTGTGKTHTMFGPEACLSSAERSDDWGLFPRVCFEVLQTMESKGPGTQYILTASAVEFYLGVCMDLLHAGAQVTIGDDHRPVGMEQRPVRQMEDAMDYLREVSENRTTRHTAMNMASEEHSGSSRSHAALILNLTQLNVTSGKIVETTFNLVDLAGAERPDKVVEEKGGERATMSDVMMAAYFGNEMPTGGQGLVINYELAMLRTEISRATEAFKGGRRYNAPNQSSTETIKFLGACLDGSAQMHMVVCLSLAPQNGWETWFSLTYGADLANLRAPITLQRARHLDKALARALKEAKAAAEAVRVPPAPGAPSERFFAKKQAAARKTAEVAERLTALS